MTNEPFKRKERILNERILLGVIVIAAAVLLLLRNIGFPFPDFLFTWPMILIVVGLISGVRHGFKNNGWWILMAIGGFFLFSREMPDMGIERFFWPLLIFAIGISIITGRGRWRRSKNYSGIFGDDRTKDRYNDSTTMEAETKKEHKDDVIDSAAIFGSVKKNMYSKNFKGGESVTVFGGSEINLMNADFTGEVKLEVVNIFGGTTLYVPAHWQIRSEVAAILGAIEDKRREPAAVQVDKVLILEGTVILGGIDIKSA
ncbi:MAG: cell wall-active antibiotics response protein [Chitinophagaceae bacterium]|nr:cell wall-active antibiotics response protein [Chitinophagaceae bacterium]